MAEGGGALSALLGKTWPRLRDALAELAATLLRPWQQRAAAQELHLVQQLLGAEPAPCSPCRSHGEVVPPLQGPCGSSQAPLLGKLPPEVMESVLLHLRRRDLLTLARCAACARGLRRHCAPLLHRVYACRQCGAPLYHPRDLEGSTPSGVRRILEDGPVVGFRLPRPLPAQGSCLEAVESKAEGSWQDARLLQILCGAVRRLGEGETKAEAAAGGVRGEAVAAVAPRLQRLACGRCRLYLGECVAAAEPPAPALGAVPGYAFLCCSYVRCLDAEGPCCEEPAALRCSGARRARGSGACGQVLCDRADVLSRRHCWAPPGGATEDAWYVNGLAPGSVAVGPARAARLAQGPMEVADVSCTACLGIVGWKFVRDLDVAERNRNQVGRFGLCTSSIAPTKESRDDEEANVDGIIRNVEVTIGTGAELEEEGEEEDEEHDDSEEIPGEVLGGGSPAPSSGSAGSHSTASDATEAASE